jgi:hypothetical protein
MSSRFEVALLRVRDLYTYGHFDGPEFAQLVGENPSSEKYDKVIESSQRTDATVNQECGVTNPNG